MGKIRKDFRKSWYYICSSSLSGFSRVYPHFTKICSCFFMCVTFHITSDVLLQNLNPAHISGLYSIIYIIYMYIYVCDIYITHIYVYIWHMLIFRNQLCFVLHYIVSYYVNIIYKTQQFIHEGRGDRKVLYFFCIPYRNLKQCRIQQILIEFLLICMTQKAQSYLNHFFIHL